MYILYICVFYILFYHLHLYLYVCLENSTTTRLSMGSNHDGRKTWQMYISDWCIIKVRSKTFRDHFKLAQPSNCFITSRHILQIGKVRVIRTTDFYPSIYDIKFLA